MLENIRQISNPLLRAIASGFFAGSLVTIPATPALFLVDSLVSPKDESNYKYIVYASLVSTAVGAIGGLSLGKSESKQKSKIIQEDQEWKDWRRFVVVRKVKESDSITSFYLQPVDGESIPNFISGQFLTIKLDIPEHSKPIIRTYSLSDYTEPPSYYRLSIKRESAPADMSAPPGLASNFMHDRIQEGSEILAKPPTGKFVLDVKDSQPVVLISNGVGITPMISMAKAASLLNPTRHIWFIHGARDGSLHAFRDEVNAIAESNPNLHIIYCYSRPRAEDAEHFQHQGYADTDLIKEIVAPEMQRLYGSTDAEYFLCGSPSFMDSLRGGLKELGVPDHRVLFESFSKPKKSEVSQVTPQDGTSTSMEIQFSKSGKTLYWNPNDGTILEFAEANEIYPDNSCRAGICGTCMCKIIEGEVVYEETPTAKIDHGSVLICISKPKTAKVVLDI